MTNQVFVRFSKNIIIVPYVWCSLWIALLSMLYQFNCQALWPCFNAVAVLVLLFWYWLFYSVQCADKTNCAQYGTSFCTNTAYTAFAQENCPKHCNLCSSSNSGTMGKLLLSVSQLYFGASVFSVNVLSCLIIMLYNALPSK